MRWLLYWPTDRFGQAPSSWLKRVHERTHVSLLCVCASTLTDVYVCVHTHVESMYEPIEDRYRLADSTARGQSSYSSTHILGPTNDYNWWILLSPFPFFDTLFLIYHVFIDRINFGVPTCFSSVFRYVFHRTFQRASPKPLFWLRPIFLFQELILHIVRIFIIFH